MANQCDLYGQITLREGVTMNHMRLAMHNFITHFGLDFDHCEASGHIEIEQTGESLTLSLCIENIWGRGGYLNEPIDELCSQLGPFTSMPGVPVSSTFLPSARSFSDRSRPRPRLSEDRGERGGSTA